MTWGEASSSPLMESQPNRDIYSTASSGVPDDCSCWVCVLDLGEPFSCPLNSQESFSLAILSLDTLIKQLLLCAQLYSQCYSSDLV